MDNLWITCLKKNFPVDKLGISGGEPGITLAAVKAEPLWPFSVNLAEGERAMHGDGVLNYFHNQVGTAASRLPKGVPNQTLYPKARP